jgi:PhnB protein
MPTLNPYLTFAGNAEEAFNFYKSVFGGEFSGLQRFKETPEASKVPKGELDKLMHVALPIGKGNVLMASDVLESMGYNVTSGNNLSLSIEAESKEEAERVFKGLSQEGKIRMPLGDTFWGAHFGMLTDKFGIHWMVSYTYVKTSPH